VYRYNRRYYHVNLLLKEKNDTLLAQNEEIESQRDSLIQANENIKIQNEQIKEQRNDLKKLAENIGNYKDKVKTQRDILQKAYEKINLHKQQIKSQRNDLKRLIEIITNYKDRLKKQQEKLIMLNEEIKSLNEYLESKVQERTEELRKIIESLSKQNQDLEQFSYIISHNLRAPVARILGLVNIFDVQILSHLAKATQDLDTIIWDLTEVISIRNSFNLLKEQINIEELAQEVCNYLEGEIKNAHAQIQSNFEVKSIFSVKSYVQSILHNLLSNAIKFRSARREPQIFIKTEYMGSYICLSISDNGLGMDLTNTNQYKIFGLYQRLHEHIEGKGMGLFLVKTQIEALNGKIEVESKLNEGSIFKVYFPIKDEESPS
jgi:signal transduction histidine kinase